jgi:hypothetical protein
MAEFTNPFRPGAGHQPPYLAGRQAEKEEFSRLLKQDTILENMLLTGLRGVGKTVLLESLKPSALANNWIWVGADLNETSSITEDNIATRLCADLAMYTSSVEVSVDRTQPPGFAADPEHVSITLTFHELERIYAQTPGLPLDKTKAVLESAWSAVEQQNSSRGIVFAYDEAQNLSDHSEKDQFPLALLLDTFQSIQRKGLPLMLVLAGLPTLFPKLVESRTFSERMFRSVFLKSLSDADSREAILKPIEDKGAVKLSEESVETVVEMSGGYPYFIQFICREVYDAFISRWDRGQQGSVPVHEIENKLDTDFFAGRWAKTTDRQRELLSVIASLDNCEEEFTVQEIVEKAKIGSGKPFSSSHTNQMLSALSSQGLVFKNRYGKYSFAVPLLGSYIRRLPPGD